KSAGIYTYTKPINVIQRNHNKEALAILETKRSQMILDRQAISTGHIPQHKLQTNFLDFYLEFMRLNSTKGNRHLASSLKIFKEFIGKDFISAIEINKSLCE